MARAQVTEQDARIAHRRHGAKHKNEAKKELVRGELTGFASKFTNQIVTRARTTKLVAHEGSQSVASWKDSPAFHRSASRGEVVSVRATRGVLTVSTTPAFSFQTNE